MKLLPFTSLFFVLLLTTPCLAAGNYVTPEKWRVTEYVDNYDLNNQNNSLQLACEIGQYVSEEYGWNCDIRQLNFTNHAPIYLNVFYPAADNKKGYEAYYGWFGPQRKEVTGFTKDKKMYYRDWSGDGNECYISGLKSYGIVESYYGNIIEETEENTTDHVVIIVPNETTNPNDTDIKVSNNTFVVDEINNNTFEDSLDSNITAENASKTIVAHGFKNEITQVIMDWTNVNLSNVNFYFWE